MQHRHALILLHAQCHLPRWRRVHVLMIGDAFRFTTHGSVYLPVWD